MTEKINVAKYLIQTTHLGDDVIARSSNMTVDAINRLRLQLNKNQDKISKNNGPSKKVVISDNLKKPSDLSASQLQKVDKKDMPMIYQLFVDDLLNTDLSTSDLLEKHPDVTKDKGYKLASRFRSNERRKKIFSEASRKNRLQQLDEYKSTKKKATSTPKPSINMETTSHPNLLQYTLGGQGLAYDKAKSQLESALYVLNNPSLKDGLFDINITIQSRKEV